MARFIKKPVEVDAIVVAQPMTITTTEGVFQGEPGDLLITGVDGRQYFLRPDLFFATHSAVDAEAELLISAVAYVTSENSQKR
jgi:hypothetical protein